MPTYTLLRAFAALVNLGLTSCSSDWEAEVLPAELHGAVLFASSNTSGLREGCRSAVYRLSDEAVRGIATKGIDFFKKTGGEPNFRWRETPGEVEYLRNGRGADVTFPGLYALGGCDNQPTLDFRSREIGEALQKPGSYYLSGGNREVILVVVPRLGLAGYYAFG